MTMLLGIRLDNPFMLESLIGSRSFLWIRLNESDTESFCIVRNFLPEFSLAVELNRFSAVTRNAGAGNENSQSYVRSSTLSDEVVRFLRFEGEVAAEEEISDDPVRRRGSKTSVTARIARSRDNANSPDRPNIDG